MPEAYNIDCMGYMCVPAAAAAALPHTKQDLILIGCAYGAEEFVYRLIVSNSDTERGERVKAEDKYKTQLVELGVYQPAFDAEIHTLCMMERELRREQKEWREVKKNLDAAQSAAGESGNTKKNDLASLHKAVNSHYALILQLRRDILSHRDALGLTPKGLQRLRGKDSPAVGPAGSAMQTVGGVLEALRDRVSGYDK